MKCTECGRELREDSRFCDQCGSKVLQKEEKSETRFNIHALLGGILFSILLTLLITGLAQGSGIPLIFGGLFLPFFWWRIKKSENRS
jgi:predicted nucleic acid-binding Zn ribbon protein